MRDVRSRYLVAATLLVLPACQRYTARPITDESLDAALRSPELSVVGERFRVEAHPLLPPIELDFTDGVNPNEAACLAVVLNTGLRAERARRGIAASELIQAGLLPNPVLSLSADHPSGGATAGAINAYAVGLDWDVGALIEHGANLNAAKAQDRAAAMDLLWQEWRVACAARLAVTQAAWLGEACVVLNQSVVEAEAQLASLRNAFDAGHTTKPEIDAAESTLQAYRSRALAGERSRDLALLEAKRAIGLPPSATLEVSHAPEVRLTKLPSADEAFAAARVSRVDLAALREGYDAQEERVRAAVLAQFPRLSIGINTARDTGNVKTIGLGVSIDLPIFDRAQGRIATERATRETLFAEYTDRAFTLRADLAAILAELDRLGPEIDAQTQYERVTRLTLASLEHARSQQLVDQFEVRVAQDAAASAQTDLLALRQRRAELLVAFETETGRFVEGSDQ